MIETRNLILRQWREDDAKALYKHASDPRVSELALWPCHTSIEMSLEVIRNVFSPNPHSFAIVLKKSDEPIGCIGLVPQGYEHYPATESEREVGYWIGFRHWGHGLATEALEALIAYCRETLKIDTLLITTDKRNIASQRVAVKCGFKHFSDYEYNGAHSCGFRLNLRIPDLHIKHILKNKEDYMDLLLIGDESEEMICRYLGNGDLYVGFADGTAVSVIITIEKDPQTVEVKNLAVISHYRRHGIGGRMLAYVERLNETKGFCLGTGETPSTLRFYESCGYHYSHRIPNFFTDNYPTPIVEEGRTLKDMICLCKGPLQTIID